MLTARVYSVEEAYQLALQLERQSTVGNTHHFEYTAAGTPHTTYIPAQKHAYDQTKSGDGRGKAKIAGDGPHCYKCKGFGHFAIVCPTKDRRVAYICEKDLVFDDDVRTGESHEIEPKPEETEPKEKRLTATELPLCVVQRVLTGSKPDQGNNEWKRTTIFHTRLEHVVARLMLSLIMGVA